MSKTSPGRTRSVEAWESILTATRAELAERGYDRLSIDRIALAAGVGKQTVYRWYPSKSSLVAECILRGYVIPLSIPLADSGDIRRDMTAWLHDFAEASRRPLAADLIRIGTAAAQESPEIGERYRAVISHTETSLSDRLRRAVAIGQLSESAPVTVVAQTMVGTLAYRILSHQELTEEFLNDLLRITLGDPPMRNTPGQFADESFTLSRPD